MQMSLICKCLFNVNDLFVTILKNLNQNETNLMDVLPCDSYHHPVYFQAL